jgi:hypothetical protein
MSLLPVALQHSLRFSRFGGGEFVISALWTLTQENIHALIIGQHMTEANRETNLILSEDVKTIDDAKVMLGRIVGDRVAVKYIFAQTSEAGSWQNQDIYSISTPRDLLSKAAEAVLGEPEYQKLCPHLAQTKTPQKS